MVPGLAAEAGDVPNPAARALNMMSVVRCSFTQTADNLPSEPLYAAERSVILSRTKKKVLIAVLIASVLAAGIFVLSVAIYNANLNRRLESYEPLMLHPEDFAGLEQTTCQ